MAETKFTPGPWWFEDRRPIERDRGGGKMQVQAKHRGEGSSYCVASLNWHESPHDEANGHLIAAAPELYEALEAVNKLVSEAAMTGFNWQDGDWAQRLFDSQQATSRALLKARGEQP